MSSSAGLYLCFRYVTIAHLSCKRFVTEIRVALNFIKVNWQIMWYVHIIIDAICMEWKVYNHRIIQGSVFSYKLKPYLFLNQTLWCTLFPVAGFQSAVACALDLKRYHVGDGHFRRYSQFQITTYADPTRCERSMRWYWITVLYCIVSVHLYSVSWSAHQSEALPVWETQREESSIVDTVVSQKCFSESLSALYHA